MQLTGVDRSTRIGGPKRDVARHATVGAMVAAIVGSFVYVAPKMSRNPLRETAVWSLLVVVSFAGWGSLMRFAVARRDRVDLGLRTVWGASAVCACGGLLASFSLMNRSAAFVVVEAGLALAIGAVILERRAVSLRVRKLAHAALSEPGLAVASAIVGCIFAIHYLGGIADSHTNPYDDDIAYLSFVRRMLDTGAVIEPFSLRRLSALGGQTLFLEIVALRAVPSQANTFDRSICLLMISLLIVGYRSKARKVPWFVALGTLFFLLSLPNLSINTASYYSGVAFFLGLFRTAVWLDQRERRPWQNALPLASVAAATCTLRQNYIVVSAVTVVALYVSKFLTSRDSLKSRARTQGVEPAFAALFTLAALGPWFVMAWQSNRTFFYPLMAGTANPAMQFQSGSSTILRELGLELGTLLDGLPVKLLGVFLFAALLLKDTSSRRPTHSFLIGSAAGFVALVHGLTQGDSSTLGRYAAGFLVVIPLAVILVTSTQWNGDTRFTRCAFVAATAFVGVVATWAESRPQLLTFYSRALRNIEQLNASFPRGPDTDPPEVSLYQQLQASVPVGAKLGVLLDEPYHFDFSRNQISNLDMPGYSSTKPGIPYFQGSEAVETYFRSLGIRYLAYVSIGYSRYHYRRDYWVQEVADEQEVWRAHAPYVIDFLDNLTSLDSRHRRAFASRGLVVVDLEEPRR